MKYSEKTGEVVYLPKQSYHKVNQLYDDKRYKELCNDIDKIQNEEIKKMLKFRASLFVIFKFDKIADYYAYQATKEEQEIFEKLALVILDKDKMIENGFADVVRDYK